MKLRVLILSTWLLIAFSCSKPPLPDYSSRLSIELVDRFDTCFINDTILVNAIISNVDSLPVSIPIYYGSLFRLVDKLPDDYFIHRSCWFLGCGVSGDSTDDGFINLGPNEKMLLTIRFKAEGECEGFADDESDFVLIYMVDVTIPEKKARYSVVSESTIKMFFKNRT